MHPQLADHLNPGCIDLAEKLMNCHAENRWAKFLGKCNALSEALNKCLGAEFEVRRKQQLIEARARQARFEEKIKDIRKDELEQKEFEQILRQQDKET
ncbi:Respiratory chain complex assembly or maintenance protein [Coemansia sp. RSA 2703]|nr:Respiratory chain complex assembly or maintenance protein [Coemansia sp. RSA 2703]KAJ2371473.1 Respiratory chain complex assembly or maintenance protein [Coemansia sp. RSA 2607]KAJ2377049.1 Respiratory chain complex assembly or maintenance protein [Coemansia sp. RSA 2603]